MHRLLDTLQSQSNQVIFHKQIHANMFKLESLIFLRKILSHWNIARQHDTTQHTHTQTTRHICSLTYHTGTTTTPTTGSSTTAPTTTTGTTGSTTTTTG